MAAGNPRSAERTNDKVRSDSGARQLGRPHFAVWSKIFHGQGLVVLGPDVMRGTVAERTAGIRRKAWRTAGSFVQVAQCVCMVSEGKR